MIIFVFMAVYTTEEATCYNVLDDEDNIIASFPTEEEADEFKAQKNLEAATVEVNAEATTFASALDSSDPFITIKLSLTKSGSLADLHTAIEAIKTTYGIESDPPPAP